MDHLTDTGTREERIRRLVEQTSLDESDATFFVDLADGKTTGDIGAPPGLTEEERRRFGLGRSALDESEQP